MNITLSVGQVFSTLRPDILDTVLQRHDLRGALAPLAEIRRLLAQAAVDAASTDDVAAGRAAGAVRPVTGCVAPGTEAPQTRLPAGPAGPFVVGGRFAGPSSVVVRVGTGQDARGGPVATCMPGTNSPELADPVDVEFGKGKQVLVASHSVGVTDTLGRQSAIVTGDAGARIATAATPSPMSLIRKVGAFFLARPHRLRSVITSPGRNTCCPPAARHCTPTARPSTRSQARSRLSNPHAERPPTLLSALPLADGAEDLAAHVDAVEVRA